MKSLLKTQPVTADALVDQPAPKALTKLAALNSEFSVVAEQSVADLQISRRRMRRRLLLSNIFAWIAIIATIWLVFF
jgi:hypothetical protein